MKPMSGLAVSVLLLQACATSPRPPAEIPPSGTSEPPSNHAPTPYRQCRTQNYKAETIFTTTNSGAVAWTVTFDAPTTQGIESQWVTVNGAEGLAVNELDCLLDEELREKCPNWIHDNTIAVDLPDGRLKARGLCGAAEIQRKMTE